MDKRDIIKSFWDNSPCGTRGISGEPGTKEFFEATEKEHYKLEPFIHRYARFENWKGKEVLEAGCGTGGDLIQFLRSGANVYGIDFSTRSIFLAQKRLNIFGFDEKRAIVGDIEELPFPDNCFDFVYSWGVLHHTLNIEKAISEIHRVLKPSGEICIMLYHKFCLVVLQLYLLFGLFALRPFKNIDEIIANHLESPGTRVYTKSQARKLFQQYSGLKIKIILTRYDLRYWRDRYKKDKFLPAWVGKIVPNSLGWFMVITGKK